ncbi:MAG: hypothetical protein UEP31_05655 [Anaerovoracaceae bacterium]|nr:hypothetical protein [Anaerovoracaceae bacterium]
MKAKNLTRLCYSLAMIVAFLMINLGSSALYYDSYNIELKSAEAKINNNEKFILPLIDTYDSSNNDSPEKFIGRSGSLKLLKDLYRDLVSAEEFEYIPITEPSIYYFGNYIGSEDTIVGGESMRNEANSEGFQTGLNTVQLNEKYGLFISDKIISGRHFVHNDFLNPYNKTIPVILGAAFADDFNIGDKFPVYYYMSKTELEVIGFTKGGSVLDCGDLGWYLDYYVILPEISLSDNITDAMCNTVIMMDKCEAYIGVEDSTNIQPAIKKISDLANHYTFKYDIKALNNISKQISSKVSDTDIITKSTNKALPQHLKWLLTLILIVGIPLLLITCFIQAKSTSYFLVIHFDRTKGISLMIVSFIFQIAIAYIIGYFIGEKVLENLFNPFVSNYIMILHGNIRVAIFLLSIMFSFIIFKTNKDGWRKKQC